MVTSVRSRWGGHCDRLTGHLSFRNSETNREWEQRWMPSITWSFFSHHSTKCSNPNTGAQYKEELERHRCFLVSVWWLGVVCLPGWCCGTARPYGRLFLSHCVQVLAYLNECSEREVCNVKLTVKMCSLWQF